MTAFAFYLLKVMICSGVLFLYYYLALRNKLFHQWNRFYLLAAIVISLVAPVAQVTIMHSADEPAKAIQVLQVFQSADGYLEEVTIGGRPSISTDQWLMMGYTIISGVFLISILISFQKVFSIIRSHTVQLVEKIKFINTNVKGTPFSFFNFIFWNEDIDLQTETGQQIFEHELVHVKEKHTIDKLFVQLVLIVFWCNPFFWLIRRELKLIHEFIADKKAVGEHGTAALAAMILSSSYPAHFNSLTNQFFQTSIKRRIAMLAKIQNPRINYLSRILAFSIIVFTVLAFTLRTKTVDTTSVKLDKTITVVIDAGHGLMANGKYNGAVIENVAEDDIVLAIANKIKELNTNDKIKIVLTRPTEQIIDLHKRVDIAKENNADLFLSIHVDAYLPDTASAGRSEQGLNGFNIYVPSKQTVFQQQSEILGSVLREELNTMYPTNPNLLTRKTSIWVLNQNVCPSALIECGYLTDKKDREFITKEKNQKEIARKILQAIERYALNQQTGKVDAKSISDTSVAQLLANSGKIFLSRNTFYISRRTRDTALEGIIIIVNGNREDPASLKGKEIIAKSAIIYKKDQTEAINKYGSEAKNGVYIFEDATIKELTESEARKLYLDTIPKEQVTISEITLNNPNVSGQQGGKKSNFLGTDLINPPLFILDGKEITKKELEKLDASAIESISVWKGYTAIEKFGQKGANGVVEMISKNNLKVREVTLEPMTMDTVPQKKNQGKAKVQSEHVFNKVEVEASIDKELWRQYLQKNLQPFIEYAAANGIDPGTYTIQVKFIVAKDGSLSNFQALNDPGYDLAKRVLEIMKNSPKWNPAMQNGKPVNSYHTQPITFVIQEQDDDKKTTVSPDNTK